MTEPVSQADESSWVDGLLNRRVEVGWFGLVIALVLIFSVVTRFADLETRVMSHDESLHTQFSWYLSEGRGFSHDPLMHGPLQMHLVAASYFLFGDSDASARFPAALAGILSVVLVLLFHRWLGRWGSVISAVLMAVSPYLLYYSRYVRNEALVVPLALLMFYAVFRYFDTREARWLYLLSVSLALHFTAKETAFIYTAQLLLFMGGFFVTRVLGQPWEHTRHKVLFSIGVTASAMGIAAAVYTLFRERALLGELSGVEGVAPEVGAHAASFSPVLAFSIVLALAGILLLSIALLLSFGRRLRSDFPSLDLLIIAGTFTMPQLAALPANLLGWDSLNYKVFDPASPTFLLVVVLFLASAAIGLIWNWRKWLTAAGIFFGIYFVFYTTLFTNINGISSGLIGSLGYWLEQHGVERGGQPWFYYLLIQIPIYEFLLAVGALLGTIFGFRRGWQGELKPDLQDRNAVAFPVIGFLAYWTFTSLAFYSLAGERMPWLTVHIVLPMVLLGGWGIYRFLAGISWGALFQNRGWISALVLLLLLISTIRLLGALLGSQPPFSGDEVDHLRGTGAFLANLVLEGALIFVFVRLARGWRSKDVVNLTGAFVLAGLFVLTMRASIRASFVNYDRATEYLVYAHSATGVKTAMDQIEELSIRLTDGLDVQVAYDDDVSWPLSWYLRNYPNQHYYGPNPTRELLNYPLILVGDNNWHLIEPLLGDHYHGFEYIRMWWPNQDYWNIKWSAIDAERSRLSGMEQASQEPMSVLEYLALTWQHIKPFFTDARTREAVLDIWLNRDFTEYGELVNQDIRLTNWSPSDRMRLYIRKDVAAQVWDYGVSPTAIDTMPFEDPYEERMIALKAEVAFGYEGTSPGAFERPRSIALAPDGTVYVADTGNHRIQHISQEGEVLHVWGSFASVSEGPAPGGTFNEPWGIAVGPDGVVYVADTWNHRVQVFTANGEFLYMFGSEGVGDSPEIFWGPRDIAVSNEGLVYVSDTGNKWVKVFEPDGDYVSQFGGAGYLAGYLDEPVGVDVGADGKVYVADTWNQRVQGFKQSTESFYDPVVEWNVDGWYGQSLENKPYLAASADGQVCVSDPEGLRVLCFDEQGTFLLGWGGVFGDEQDQFSLVSGIDFDEGGRVWVVDTGNHRIMRFTPDLTQPE